MCDYSLMHLASRPAKVGEKLVTKRPNSTTGLFSPEDTKCTTAVCVLPGTELSFDNEVAICATIFGSKIHTTHKTAIFRQINKGQLSTHHDVVEFPDGTHAMLNALVEGQKATVLQLPAEPKNEAEKEEQRRVEVVA